MITVLMCIQHEHDLGLVLLAALVCVLASCTALRFQRALAEADRSARVGWAAGMALIAGGGVWATHFIAMLAYDHGLSFQILGTVASLIVAVGGMGAGLWLARPGAPRRRLIAGGLLIGASVTAMHFIGIGAIQSRFQITWSPAFVIASMIAAGLGGVAAMAANDRLSGWLGWIAPCACLVGGIVGLHFTAMAAINVIADVGGRAAEAGMDRNMVALTIGLVAMAMIAAAVLASAVHVQNRKRGIRNMQVAFSGIPLGLAMFDAAGRLVLWNEAFETLIAHLNVTPVRGMTRPDLLAQEMPIYTETPDPQVSVWAEAIGRGETQGLCREWRAPSGAWLRMEISVLPGGDSVTMVSDVTQAREHAAAMAHARDRAEAANRAKSDFLANMSHEIRTPLNGVIGMIQVMDRDDLSDIQRSRVKVIRDSGHSLLAILNDVLDLSKIEAARMELEMTPVDVADLTRSVAATFQGLATSKSLAFELQVDPSAAGAWRLDGPRVRQVMSNLVGNALKFTAAGHVRIAVSIADDHLRIEVSDTGIGIAPAAQAALFEKFTQADTSTTRRYGGSGLGLAICKSLAELMGGEVRLESERGVGSRFTVLIPTERASGPAAAPVETPETDGDFTQLRILAAEDNETNQLVLDALLKAIDCDLTLVTNGIEAVTAATADRYDLILMDVQMPEMNGVEATRLIRDWEYGAGRDRTPIIALTANVMPHQLEEYRAAGVDASVAKPLDSGELFSTMSRVMSGAEDRIAA